MYIDQNTIISVASLIGAIIAILGCIFAAYRWYLKQNKQDDDIKAMKDEQCLLCYGIIACLDGLKQMGANGNVTEAHTKLEKHLNQSAHK